MANIIIPVEHQSAPTLRYDAGLARAVAEAKGDTRAMDWEQFDWNAVRQRTQVRSKMQNLDFDRELETPGHYDPAMSLLRRLEHSPHQWVEENLELWESNCEKAKANRLVGQERWEGKENEEARLVNPLYAAQFMRKLRAAGVDARDAQEHPNARLWLNDWTRGGLIGVNCWVTPTEMDEDGYLLELSTVTTQRQKDLLTENFLACREGRKVRRTITSIQDPGPEYSILRINDHGVATKEKYRGWRTALLVLIAAEVISEEEALRAFGPPTGPAGAWYRAQLKAYRQIKLGRPI